MAVRAHRGWLQGGASPSTEHAQTRQGDLRRENWGHLSSHRTGSGYRGHLRKLHVVKPGVRERFICGDALLWVVLKHSCQEIQPHIIERWRELQHTLTPSSLSLWRFAFPVPILNQKDMLEDTHTTRSGGGGEHPGHFHTTSV